MLSGCSHLIPRQKVRPECLKVNQNSYAFVRFAVKSCQVIIIKIMIIITIIRGNVICITVVAIIIIIQCC